MAMTDLARLGFGSLLSAWLGYGIITMTMGSAWFSYLLGSLVAYDYLGFAWPLVPVGCYGADRLNPAAQLRYLGLVGWLSAPVGIRLLGMIPSGWLWQSYYY